MPRPAPSPSRRRFLLGLTGLAGALLPGAALAAAPTPVLVSATSAPAGPPILPLPPGAPAHTTPPQPPAFAPFWVAPFKPTPLALDPSPDATPAALAAQFGPLKVTGPAKGGFYPVEEPFSKVQGWIASDAIGKVGQPPQVAASRWWGAVVADQAFGRAEPNRGAPVVATYRQGQVLGFDSW